MAVDRAWLDSVRQKNRQAFGMSGLGQGAGSDIVEALRRERDFRTKSIHEGRLERTDPSKPTEGSVESIVASLGPAPAPGSLAAPPVPTYVYVLAAVGILGAAGLAAWALTRRRS